MRFDLAAPGVSFPATAGPASCSQDAGEDLAVNETNVALRRWQTPKTRPEQGDGDAG